MWFLMLDDFKEKYEAISPIDHFPVLSEYGHILKSLTILCLLAISACSTVLLSFLT